jgi:OOP family OmpA-OmpF porin
MKFVKTCVVAIAASLAASAAHAQETGNNWYGTIGAGVLVLNDQHVTSGNIAATGEYNTGYAIQGSVGYAFTNNLRTELELGYADSSIKDIKVSGSTFGVSGAGLSLYQAHAAAFYDFNKGGISPYVGAGLGLTHSTVGAASAAGATIPKSSDTNFSMFGEAGVAFPISQTVAIVPSARYAWVDTGGNGADNNTGWLFKAALRFNF